MGLLLYWAIDAIRRNKWKQRCQKAEDALWISNPMFMHHFYRTYEDWKKEFE